MIRKDNLMYELFLKTLEDAGIVLPTWFFGIVLVIIVLGAFFFIIKKYIKPLILYIEDTNKKLEKTNEIDELRKQQIEEIKRSIEKDDELKKDIKNLSEAVSETQEHITTFADNRIKDRAQSFQIQKELIDAQKQISISLESVEKKLDQMKIDTDRRFMESEEKHDARIRAELKDKIGSLYRIYHNKNAISSMEFEALEDLIRAYENSNGNNSFIHSIVEKEMYTWRITDEEINKI